MPAEQCANTGATECRILACEEIEAVAGGACVRSTESGRGFVWEGGCGALVDAFIGGVIKGLTSK